MTKHALLEVMESQMGLITRDQALELGLTERAIRRRLKIGEWVGVFPNVYRSVVTPETWLQKLTALSLFSPAAALSHRTALELHKLDGERLQLLEITAPRAARVRRPGIIVHTVQSIPRSDVTRIDELRVTSVSRTLVDLGAVLDEEALEVALDSAFRKRLVSLKHLRWQLQQCGTHGKKGPAALRRLLDLRDPNLKPTESALETKLFRVLRKAGLPLPIPQFEIWDGGRFIARPDFAYVDHRLAIEAESVENHFGFKAYGDDWERRNKLTRMGWRVIHVTSRDVKTRPGWVVDQIASALGCRQGLNLAP